MRDWHHEVAQRIPDKTFDSAFIVALAWSAIAIIDALGGWLSALEVRTHRNKAVVALANKLTRVVWAILTRPGTVYLQSKGATVS